MKFFKRGISAALSLLLAGGLISPLIQSVPVEAVTTGGFSDVKQNDWFLDYAIDCDITGLMGQSDDNTFKPYDKMTRAMVATVLYRAAGEPEVTSSAAARFPDVKDGQWYSTGIAWAAENGVVNGYSNGNFGPFDNITREQMVAMIVNYLRSLDINTSANYDLSDFTDAGKVSYGENALKFCVAYGIISGKNNGTKLDPKANATRAEAAKIILSGLSVTPMQTEPQEVIDQYVNEKLANNETEIDYYEVKSVAERTWRIMENYRYKHNEAFSRLATPSSPSAFYIVQHDNQNLIVDAGNSFTHRYGPVNLWAKKLIKAILENLTAGKPTSIALTNTTTNHIGLVSTNDVLNNSIVDAVLVPSNQLTLAQALDSSWSSKIQAVQPDSAFVIGDDEYQTCELNGFSEGSMVVYSPDQNLMFAGDNAKRKTYVFGKPETNPLGLLKADIENLQSIIAGMGNPKFFVSHYYSYEADMTTSYFLELADDKLTILNGLNDGSTYISELQSSFIANLTEDSITAPLDSIELKNDSILSNDNFYTTPANVEAYLAN